MNLPSDGIVDFVEIVKQQPSALKGLFKEIVCTSGRNKLQILFDENGYVKEEIERHSDGFIFKNLYSYSNGKVACVTRTMNNKMLWISNYHYDNDGYFIEIDDTQFIGVSNGQLRKIVRYTYDSINHFTTKHIEIGDDFRYAYTFNEVGILVNIQYGDGRRIQPILTRTGNEIKVEMGEWGEKSVSIIKLLRYSDNNNLLLYSTQYVKEKQTITFDYIYDDAGLLEMLTRNGKLVARISYST